MNSCMQTVEIRMPFSPLTFYGMEPIPALPDDVKKSYEGFAVRTYKDGVTTIWYPTGEVYMEMPDGITKNWIFKPTLDDIVHLRPNAQTSVQFHKNDVVTAVFHKNGAGFYWSPPIKVEPVEGPFESGWYHATDGWIFEDDEQDMEEEDIGYDSHYYRYG